MSHQRLIPLVVALLALGGSVVAPAQDASPTIELVLETGTPLRVILPERVRMRDVGQPLAGSLLEDVYSYDRVVLPAGTRVLGRVARFESVRGRQRAGAMLGGDFTPLRRAILEFDSLVLDDGCQIEVRTEVRSTTEHLVLSTREAPKKNVAEEAAAQVAAHGQEDRGRGEEAPQGRPAQARPRDGPALSSAVSRRGDGLHGHPAGSP